MEEKSDELAKLFFNMLQDANAVISAVGKDDSFKRLTGDERQLVVVVVVFRSICFFLCSELWLVCVRGGGIETNIHCEERVVIVLD